MRQAWRVLGILALGCVPGQAATIAVNCPADSLQTKINAATAGDTLQVTGTCNVGSGALVNKALTILGSGPDITFLDASNASGAVLEIFASNVRVDGFTVRNTGYGVSVFTQTGNPTTSNVTVQNVRVTPSGSPATNTHGIAVINAATVLIDRCTVDNAWGNGIYVDSASKVSLINSTVSHTTVQNGIAFVKSDDGQIVGNTVRLAAFHGILLVGSRFTYVALNDVQQHLYDGITVTVYCQSGGSICEPDGSGNRRSLGNLLVGNKIANQKGRTDGLSSGTGIWLNLGSDGTCVLGNDESGAVEGGMTSFDASKNLFLGNRVSDNVQAGMLLWDVTDSSLSPRYNHFRRNYVFNNPNNAQIFSRGSTDGDVGFNFMDDADDSRPGEGGVRLDASPEGVASQRFTLFANTYRHIQSPHYIVPSTRDVTVFRERYFDSPDHYAGLGATVRFDRQLQIGGNHYEGFAASANPSPGTTRYTDFIIDTLGNRGGGYEDRFPYRDENFGRAYAVSVLQPVSGTTVAAGSKQVIEWRSEGCALVDISYVVGVTATAIEQDYPDTGFYYWSVPSGVSPGSYTVEVGCRTSIGADTGVVGVSTAFTVAKQDLVLLTPNFSQPVSGTVRVTWKKAATVGAVAVDVSVDGGAFSQVASGISSVNFVDVAAPGTASSRLLYRVRSQSDASAADTSDGYLAVRTAAAGTFKGITGGEDWLMGVVKDIEWTTPNGATFVDLDLYDSGLNQFVSVGTGFAACHPRLSWIVDERWGLNHSLRATFKDVSGNTLGSAVTSPTFNIRYSTGVGTKATFYRLYNSVARTHLYTTDAYEYSVLAARPGWSGEGPVGELLNGPGQVDGVDAIPYYRLYRWPLTRHFYTSDRYEYFTLRDTGLFDAEGPIGYIFPSQVTGTIPFYRASHVVFPYHLYTTDAYEYSVRTAPGGGWTAEGVVGYIYPKP